MSTDLHCSRTSSDGIRIDSAKHVETSFYAGFNSAAGVFAMGEVFNGDPVYLASYQKYMDGLLDYARQVESVHIGVGRGYKV